VVRSEIAVKRPVRVGWSLTSLFSTNTAISDEKNGK